MQPMPLAGRNTTLEALISLVDEPDDTAFGVIRSRILTLGPDAIAPLEEVMDNSFDPLVRERLREIVGSLRMADLRDRLADWIATGSSDLLAGFILVSKTEYPDLDEDKVVAEIARLRTDIWVELHDNLTALESIRVMNHVIFDLQHFAGNKGDMTALENNLLNKLIETRLGNPLTIGMLYLILARQLGLPVYGVNLPQHFILAYLADPPAGNPSEEDVLFYINPFNRGTVFTRHEIERYIRQLKVNPEPGFFAPCSHPVILRRLIGNLVFSHRKAGRPGRAGELETLLSLFE